MPASLVRPFLAQALCALLFLCGTAVRAQEIRIGVCLVSPPWSASEFIQQSVSWLRWKIPGHTFAVDWVSVDEIENLFSKGALDIAILPSSTVSPPQHAGYRVLATMISAASPLPDTGSACTFVVPEDSPARTVADLRGLRAASANAGSVPGCLACLREIAALGFDPEKFFSSAEYLGDLNERRVLSRLRRGRADVAMVRAGFAEDVRQASAQDAFEGLRVIGERSGDGLALVHSSRPYPGPTVVASAGLPVPVLHAVLSRLLEMPANGWGQQWTVPADETGVRELARELKIGPFEYLRSYTLGRIWREYGILIIAAVLALAAFAFHAWGNEKLVRLRTRELRRAMELQAAAEAGAREKSERMEALQRKAAAGLLSSVFAHEISAPLGAASSLARGLRTKIDSTLEEGDGSAGAGLLEELDLQLETLESQMRRIGRIVSRARSYARGGQPGRVRKTDLSSCLAGVVNEWPASKGVPVSFRRLGDGPFAVAADPLEMELIALNLIRNAVEACAGGASPEVGCLLGRSGGDVEFSVADNGPELTDADFERISSPGRTSTKEGGTGLGLDIVTALAEKYGGRISFEKRREGGLKVTVSLPAAEEA